MSPPTKLMRLIQLTQVASSIWQLVLALSGWRIMIEISSSGSMLRLRLGEKMNTRKLLVSVLMLGCVLLAACAPVATPPAPTVVPPTVAPTTAPTQEGLTTFSPKTFNLPITLSYGPEWRVAEE